MSLRDARSISAEEGVGVSQSTGGEGGADLGQGAQRGKKERKRKRIKHQEKKRGKKRTKKRKRERKKKRVMESGDPLYPSWNEGLISTYAS